jgi:hypothetical protein
MAVNISMLVFCVLTPCELVGRYQLLDKHTASISRRSLTLYNTDYFSWVREKPQATLWLEVAKGTVIPRNYQMNTSEI